MPFASVNSLFDAHVKAIALPFACQYPSLQTKLHVVVSTASRTTFADVVLLVVAAVVVVASVDASFSTLRLLPLVDDVAAVVVVDAGKEHVPLS